MTSWLDRLKIKLGSPASTHSLTGVVMDMHAHWIPGIDDGAKDLEESLDILRKLAELGYQGCIATPHIMSDYYRNIPEIILSGLERVRHAANEEGIPLFLDAAAEYYLDEGFLNLLEPGKMLSFGKDYLLFELSYLNQPHSLQQAIFQIQTCGYQPVLAHPERYPYFADSRSLSVFRELTEQNVLLQLNLGSLVGQHGPQARQTGRDLVDAGLIHFAGSDVHRSSQVLNLNALATDRWYNKLVESNSLRNSELLPSQMR